MDFSSPKSLAKELVKMRLVDKQQAVDCLRALGSQSRKGIDLLAVFLDQHALTPFQIDAIKRLDTGILILGGNKLLYANAAGSFARVYRGESLENGQIVGVKVLRDRWVNDPETVDLFQKEAELGQKLKHPNIVPIYDVGYEGGYHFFTMDFVQGGNLRDLIQIRKTVEPLETLKYSIDMASGLEYALSLGVTHRDLKTTNVLFSIDGVAKLIDFGLATDEEMLKKNGGAGIQHALEYSTLEKGTGALRNDPRSDLFFLGTIMYEMLLGQPAYPRTRDREERKQITRYRNIRPLTEAMPSCPRYVSSIVDRLLHINPEERYQSPTEVLQDLTEASQRLAKETQEKQTISSQAANSQKSSSTYSSILCVEKRMKEQDILRDYFSNHGYRVLMMSDAQRAVQRIQNDPPTLVLLMALSADEETVDDYNQLIEATAKQNVPTLVVPNFKNGLRKPKENHGYVRICTQQMSLREMRTGLKSLAKKQGIELQLKLDKE